MCKENKINYNKQEYKILFSNDKILFKNNSIKFTSGAKKYLSFYGKIYSDKKEKIIETIYFNDDLVNLEMQKDDLLIILGGIKNSTVVGQDEELLHFYVAPSYMLEMQDPEIWQNL
jgi:hypothetical protein